MPRVPGRRPRCDAHADTLSARANLAGSYRSAGRIKDAITLFEQVLADSERLLSAEHPNTLTVHANLGPFMTGGAETDG